MAEFWVSSNHKNQNMCIVDSKTFKNWSTGSLCPTQHLVELKVQRNVCSDDNRISKACSRWGHTCTAMALGSWQKKTHPNGDVEVSVTEGLPEKMTLELSHHRCKCKKTNLHHSSIRWSTYSWTPHQFKSLKSLLRPFLNLGPTDIFIWITLPRDGCVL